MRKCLFPLIVLLAAVSCKEVRYQPRPTIPLVHVIAADTAGAGRLAAMAGKASGSVAIIGEPEDVIVLAHHFQGCDRVDNVDGTPVRDSLPDFAGENFDVIMDAFSAPYSRFWTSAESLADTLRHTVLDSLREVAVLNAVCAWDSLSWRSTADAEPLLRKERAKLLIFTSPLQAQWGLFDVDTLQQMTGGKCLAVSTVQALLEDAYASGARSLAVWTTREVRNSGAWQAVFASMNYPDAHLSVFTPDAALDVRTELRSVLRQYRSTGRVLDALLIDSFTVDFVPVMTELSLIRNGATAEDNAFQAMMAPDFRVLDPSAAVIDATYRLMRQNHLFTHRIALPTVHYYETAESQEGTPLLVETSDVYAQSTYVSNLH